VTCSLFIDDTNTSVPETKVCGYESITDIIGGKPTGSRAFPLRHEGAGVLGNGGHVIIRKSTSSHPTGSRDWVIFADSRSMYCYTLTGDSGGSHSGMAFGEFFSLVSGSTDYFRTLLIGRVNTGTITSGERLGAAHYMQQTKVSGHYCCRPLSGYKYFMSSSMVKFGKGSVSYSSCIGGPSVPRNTIDISPVWIGDPIARQIRGKMRGFYHLPHPTSQFTHFQKINGEGNYAGKVFMIIKGYDGNYCMEISDTLDTN